MDKLAINGGVPVRDTFLPYGKQFIDEEDIDAVIKVLSGDYLTTGPNINEFETTVKTYVGAKHAVAISNGTAALHAACYAAGIGQGDEVIVSSITFAASSNAILYCGGKPVFADIDKDTYNIDPETIESLITNKTKALVVVDMTGQSVDIDKIMEIAQKHDLIVIEDAAHSLGSSYKNRMVGTNAHMTTFSFHPVKPITTAEGGMIMTDDDELYKKLTIFRSHGITREKEDLIDNHGPWYYEQQQLGYNYRMTDLQAALGNSQMNKIDKFLKRRKEIVNYYNGEFANIEELEIPFQADYSDSGWHLYMIKLNLEKLKVSRKDIFEALQKENIGVNVHYLPVYLHPYYQDLGYKKGICPNAEYVYERLITLPLHQSMTDEDAEDVVRAVKKVLSYYGVNHE